jgi:antitoxin YefM
LGQASATCISACSRADSPHARHVHHQLPQKPRPVLDGVNDDHEPMIITREGGKPSAVLMSLEDFNSWEETCHLLKSPANAARLRDSIAEIEAGQ